LLLDKDLAQGGILGGVLGLIVGALLAIRFLLAIVNRRLVRAST
jgi:hypothetical protein